MPAKKLDSNFLKHGLVCPDHLQHIEYTSDDRSGLYIEVRNTSPGQGTYWWRFKSESGRTARIKVGRTESMSINQAKALVRVLRAKRDLGENLVSANKKKKSLTWDTFFTDHYLPHSKQHLRSWSNLEEMHRLRISQRFGNVQLNKFTRRDVQQWLNELRNSGLAPSTCSHYGKLLRQALNVAVSWEMLDSNPIARIKLFNVDNRIENILTKEQLQQLMNVLDKPTDRRKTASQVIKFLLFTGARVNEALNARWVDIDHTNRTWTVQATNSKSKQRRSIPLNDAAMAVLEKLPTKGKSEWLFISRQGDGTQRMTTISKVWQEIRKEPNLKDAGLSQLRLHDLRHNYASMLVNSGRTLYEVQQILGHSDSKVTERYAHLSTKTLQDAANSASTYLDKALEKTAYEKH